MPHFLISWVHTCAHFQCQWASAGPGPGLVQSQGFHSHLSPCKRTDVDSFRARDNNINTINCIFTIYTVITNYSHLHNINTIICIFTTYTLITNYSPLHNMNTLICIFTIYTLITNYSPLPVSSEAKRVLDLVNVF